MSNIGKVAYLMIMAGFPLYLLWKGELGAYLALTQAPVGTPPPSQPSSLQSLGIPGLVPTSPIL